MNKLPAEFLGTFFFCLIALLSGNPLAAALALAALTYALGYLSGGHFNPATSIAVWLRGQLEKTELLQFLAVQLVAALCAALFFKFFGGQFPTAKPNNPPAFLTGLVLETLFTFLPSFVFLHVRTARQQLGNPWYGAAIGATHYAGVSALAPLFTAACNPALGLAYALSGQMPLWMIATYLMVPGIAGPAAAISYRLLNPND